MLDISIKENYTSGDTSPNNVLGAEEINSAFNEIENVIISEGISLNGASTTQLNEAINKKVQESFDALNALKIDKGDFYTSSDINILLQDKSDISIIYTRSEIDAFNTLRYLKTETYSKTEVDTLLNVKVDSINVFTKSEMVTQLALKANVDDSTPGVY